METQALWQRHLPPLWLRLDAPHTRNPLVQEPPPGGDDLAHKRGNVVLRAFLEQSHLHLEAVFEVVAGVRLRLDPRRDHDDAPLLDALEVELRREHDLRAVADLGGDAFSKVDDVSHARTSQARR